MGNIMMSVFNLIFKMKKVIHTLTFKHKLLIIGNAIVQLTIIGFILYHVLRAFFE